jgi:hypothetical protein
MIRKLGITRLFVLLEELPGFVADGSPELGDAGEAGAGCADAGGSCAGLTCGCSNSTANTAETKVFIRQFVLEKCFP